MVDMSPEGGGGGVTPLFGIYGYVPLNRVGFSESWVLNIISLLNVLNRVSFETRSLKKGVSFGGVRYTCITKFLKII